MSRSARSIIFSLVLLFVFSGSIFAQTTVSPTKSYQASGASDQDDMAVWIHPTDFSKSTIIGSDKASGKIFVYDVEGNTLQTISSGGQPGNIDLRYNFPLGGKLVDIVVYNERSSSTLHVYSVDASTRQLTRVDAGITTSGNYGVCLYRSPSTGKFYSFKTAENGNIEQHELFDDGSGRVKGTMVRSFSVGSQTEGCVADDENKVVYMAEEGKAGVGAIWKYSAEPNGGDTRSKVDDSNGHLNKDVEGVTIYHTSDGKGYLIASSQGASEFDVYDRLSPHLFKFTFKVSGTSSTDGIDVSNINLGSSFPQGLFLAHSGGASFKGVPWPSIANTGGLTIDTTWNPRGGGGPPPPTTTPTKIPTSTPTPTTKPGTPTPTRKPTPTDRIPGDIDGDGDVDIFDYNLLVTNFGATGGNPADIDGDGDVDIFDYNLLITNFGRTSGTPTPGGPTPTLPGGSGNLITTGVTYNSDSSARISRPDAVVRVPVNVINPTQGWVAVRLKMGFASTTNLSPDPVIWDMSETDPRDLFVYYDVSSDTFHLPRAVGVGGAIAASGVQNFAAGDYKTVIAAWTANSLKISVDGETFRSVNGTVIPAQAAFLIGSSLVQGAHRQPNSDYYWVAAGSGTLTDAQAAIINSFGNVDKNKADFPGSASFVWWANSEAYQ